MKAFEVEALARDQASSNSPYLEFLRESSMSAGLYVLPAGSADPQQPHNEDELYYVVSGAGRIRVGDDDRLVQPGSIVFVGRQVEHHFHSITDTLYILVFFAPPETDEVGE